MLYLVKNFKKMTDKTKEPNQLPEGGDWGNETMKQWNNETMKQ